MAASEEKTKYIVGESPWLSTSVWIAIIILIAALIILLALLWSKAWS